MRVLLKVAAVTCAAVSMGLPMGAQTIIVQPSNGGRTVVAPGAKVAIPIVVDMSQAGGITLSSLSSSLLWTAGAITLDSVTTGSIGSIFADLSSAASGQVALDFSASTIVSTTTIANAWFTASATAGASSNFYVIPQDASDNNDNDLSSFLRMKGLQVCVGSNGLWGDANADATINIIDAQQLARYAVGLSVANAAVLAAQGDVTNDNQVNILDAQQVARFSVGLTAAARISTSLFTPPAAASVSIDSSLFNATGGAFDPLSRAIPTSMPLGSQAQIIPTVLDANAKDVSACAQLTYASTNPAVATVSSRGLIDAVGPGTTTISLTSGSFSANVSVTVITFGTFAVKSGTGFSLDPAGVSTPSTQPVFVASTAAGAPAQGIAIDVTVSGGCDLSIGGGTTVTSAQYTSDAQGEIHPILLLSPAAGGAGCLVSVSSLNLSYPYTAHSIHGTYPAGTTHAWTGATDGNWSTASNWVRPGTTAAAPSSSTDQLYILPFSFFTHLPTLPANTTVKGIAIPNGGYIDLGNHRLIVGSGGVSGFGSFVNGSVETSATSNVSGSFETLTSGVPGACGGASPIVTHLGLVIVQAFFVSCQTVVDTSVSVTNGLQATANSGQSQLTVSATASLYVAGNLNWAGDVFNMFGFMGIGGNALFGGTTVNAGFPGSDGLQVAGSATFNAASATYTGLTVSVSGDMVVGGGSAGPQRFVGGNLNVSGNFTQQAGAVTNTFVTSQDHFMSFQGSGSTPQLVTLAAPAANPFTIFDVFNSGSGGVQLNSDVSVAKTSGSAQGQVALSSGKLLVPPGKVFTVDGNFVLGSGTFFTNNGTVTITNGSCSGKSAGATVSGTGTVNGAAMASACP